MILRPAAKTSLKKMLAFWLVVMIVLPTIPLAFFTWKEYHDEISQFEDLLDDTNRQFTILAGTLLKSILNESAQHLRHGRTKSSDTEDLPFDHTETVSSDGIILESSIAQSRIGQHIPASVNWSRIDTPGGSYDVSSVTQIPEMESGRVLLRIDEQSDTQRTHRIAYLDPNYLYAHLTSSFDSLINRHIYAVDQSGAPIFYSDPHLINQPEKFLINDPVVNFIKGDYGSVSYVSSISKRERSGFVAKMDGSGWGIIVSADIADSMISIRERFAWLVVTVLFAGGLAVMAFILFSSRLIIPLSDLARQMRRRDYNLFAPVIPSASINRIEELAQLASDLNRYIEHCVIAEKKTIHAEKLATLGELTTGLAHELGAPLNVVRGSAQLVKRKYPDDASSQAALDRIITQTVRITDLIRNLLDIARLEKVFPESTDLKRLIEKAWETASAMYPKTIPDFHFPESKALVFIRRRPMEHAFLNLFTNACQAMEGEGNIIVRIEAVEGGREWRIDVEDTGPGIDMENIELIFKPFFSTKSAGKGSGLGLALVERVVRENGGVISADPDMKNGARFRIILPVLSEDAAHDQVAR